MTQVPRHASFREHLERLAHALEAEIEVIEKSGGDQVFELTSGERDPRSTGAGGVYVFMLADSQLRLPEDASGTLHVGAADLPAFVIAHEGNRIWLLLESAEDLPKLIPSARLQLSETELLQRLRERMEELGTDEARLAPKTFGYEPIVTGSRPLPPEVAARVGDGSMRVALEKALGSEVIFIWGPPGTGKTFSIAALVAALVDEGETVLVTSHTHAAVEQALWAAIEPASASREAGLLAGSAHVREGRILKVGPLRDPKIPIECHLDGRLALVAEERAAELAEILAALDEAQGRLHDLRRAWEPWHRLDEARAAHEAAEQDLAVALEIERVATNRFEEARETLDSANAGLQRAQTSFILGRRGRVERAQAEVSKGARLLSEAERAVRASAGDVGARRLLADTTQEAVRAAEKVAESAGDRNEIKRALDDASAKVLRLSSKADALRGMDDDLANELLAHAAGLFATLTKLYIDPKLQQRSWDTVIIDEASMALPPLVAWATSKARRRVVVCGDFLQLSPIVHSRDGIGAEELATDVFHLRGIPDAVAAGEYPPELAQLQVQRRMHPKIADVARTLAYGSRLTDHEDVVLRPEPEWLLSLDARPPSAQSGLWTGDDTGPATGPLLLIDTTALGSWSGRLKGTLSRFNFYSAQVALEVAAMLATRVPRPETGEARPIGVITPYAAQRRYLSKLLEALGELSAWVTVGTVHTFQGNECDVIIFDSVLAEPHWTSRLTNPHEAADVKRDLNVAVTRARHQLIVLGDGRWLDKYAKDGSGFGTLWTHLKSTALRVDVRSMVGEDLRARVAADALKILGWGDATRPGAVTLYDERNFYPAFIRDVERATEQVVLYTPYIGKTRWPRIEPVVRAAATRGVEVVLLHKPLTDDAWRQGDPNWGAAVFASLADAGVHLVPVSGVHAKTIVIDGRIVYEGSLNWASQTDSYEHMLRLESREVAALIERMMQLRDLVPEFKTSGPESRCPKCGGPLVVVNQARTRPGDTQPLKLACANYSQDKRTCDGYLRGAHQRAPFEDRPVCEEGQEMTLSWTKTGRPWMWRCEHRGCHRYRWTRGDPELDAPTRSTGRAPLQEPRKTGNARP